MTTKVTIEAHVPPEKEVVVNVIEDGKNIEHYALQDGEITECYAYDGRIVTAQEVEK